MRLQELIGNVTKDTLANLLNGRQYGEEISPEVEAEAKKAGLVVVFGASDDLIEFRGAIHDEADCYNGGLIRFTPKGILTELSERDSQEPISEIEALWNNSWSYRTKIPHAEFRIVENNLGVAWSVDKEPRTYCKGIVFSVKDLPRKNLIELPCNLGDTVYDIMFSSGTIAPGIVKGFVIDENGVTAQVEFSVNGAHPYRRLEKIGQDAFLSIEEATEHLR